MSAATQKAAGDAKRKKIIVIGLAALLGVVLIIQGPTLLSAFGGGSSDDSAAAETADGTSADGEGVEGGEGTDVSLPESVQLSDSDIPTAAGPGELSTLSRFSQGDTAFNPLVVAQSTSEGAATDPTSDAPSGDAPVGDSGSTSTGDTGTDTETTPDGGTGDTSTGSDTGSTGGDTSSGAGSTGDGSTGDGTADADPNKGIFTSGSGVVASLSINDITEEVVVGANFPSSNPVFKLVLIDGDAINVGLVNGAFSTGTSTIDVELGESRTLLSQPDGTRYRVKYTGRQGG
jgi:hypothetical protein